MKKKIRLLVLTLLTGGAWTLSASGQSIQDNPPNLQVKRQEMVLFVQDQMAGTWELNVAKSHVDPGPALKSGTVKIETHGSGIRCVLDTVDAEGNARHGEWTANYDGKDYASGMAPFADTIALNRINDNTVDAVYKRGGKEILNERWVLSKDGKTLTMIQKEKNSTGQGLNNSLVYDKVE